MSVKDEVLLTFKKMGYQVIEDNISDQIAIRLKTKSGYTLNIGLTLEDLYRDGVIEHTVWKLNEVIYKEFKEPYNGDLQFKYDLLQSNYDSLRASHLNLSNKVYEYKNKNEELESENSQLKEQIKNLHTSREKAWDKYIATVDRITIYNDYTSWFKKLFTFKI